MNKGIVLLVEDQNEKNFYQTNIDKAEDVRGEQFFDSVISESQ